MAEDYYNISILSDSNNSYSNVDVSFISNQLLDFDKLRISALTKAAEISPLVKEVTIGPNSPIKKEVKLETVEISEKVKVNKQYDKVENDINTYDLRYTADIKQYESNLNESLETIFKNLIDRMVINRHEIMKQYWMKQTENYERRALEHKARKLQMLQELRENDNSSVLEIAKRDEQNTQYLNMKILEEQHKAAARFASITESHMKICICYNDISNIIKCDEYGRKIREKYSLTINTVIANINNVMEICKSGNITDNEVKQSEELSLNIENLNKLIVDEINQLKQEDHRRKQHEEEVRKREIEEREKSALAEREKSAIEESEKNAIEERKNSVTEADSVVRVAPQPRTIKPLFYSSKNYTNYCNLKKFLNEYEGLYKDLMENTTLKKFRFDCQKAVNTPVNTISSVSGVHMRDKYDKLSKLLQGARVQVQDTFVTITQHPQGLPYCTALLAKKIVRQGDLLVSSNPEAAFPLASVTVALWSQFPELGKLIEANFHRECPYLVPMFLPQKEGQSDKDFYMSRGYTYSEDGVVEKHDKFLKRMSGIFQLCCAIWITKPPRFINSPNAHGLQYGWKWLASFINLKPEPDISATLLYDFFTVCGSEFLKHYGSQFKKIIKLICTDYLAILENIDEGGPKTRLEVLLQNILKTGHIPPPTGLLSPNTW